MNDEMRVVTDKMQGILTRIADTSAQLDDSCDLARDAWDDLGVIFKMISSSAIKNVQSQVKGHLKTGKSGIKKAIAEYEKVNGELKRDANGNWYIEFPTKQTVVKTVKGKNGQMPEIIVSTEDVNTKCKITVSDANSAMKRRMIESTDFPRTPQIHECDANGNKVKNAKGETVSGRCNVSAITNLLNRRYQLDTNCQGKNYFSHQNVFDANGCTVIKDFGTNHSGTKGQIYVQYKGDTGGWANGKEYTNGEFTYKTVKTGKAAVKNVVDSQFGGSYENYMASLLDQHPEGICIRSASANHVVTITDYSVDANGKVTLYVDDPVGIQGGKTHQALTSSYVWNGKNFWSGLDNNLAVTYLEAV